MWYLGPRLFVGALSRVGSGLVWKRAGKRPACSVSRPRSLPKDSPLPPSVTVFRPGPEMVAWSGPFAAAAAGSASATASTSRKRFIVSSFFGMASPLHRPAGGGSRLVVLRRLDLRRLGGELLSNLELLHRENGSAGRLRGLAAQLSCLPLAVLERSVVLPERQGHRAA